MAGRGKTFELLDFPRFAAPSVSEIDAAMTALRLNERLGQGGGSFMSYASIWPQMSSIVSGMVKDSDIDAAFDVYDDDFKNISIREAARLLNQHFGGRGKWYGFSGKPFRVLGFWFKPSIKGVWWFDGKAYAVLVNARKSQRLTTDDIRFLGRGVYELHCVDDPNDPVPTIVDLSEPLTGQGRRLRVHTVSPDKAISLDKFDATIREFLKGLELAGVAVPTDAADVVSLFKKR